MPLSAEEVSPLALGQVSGGEEGLGARASFGWGNGVSFG